MFTPIHQTTSENGRKPYLTGCHEFRLQWCICCAIYGSMTILIKQDD